MVAMKPTPMPESDFEKLRKAIAEFAKVLQEQFGVDAGRVKKAAHAVSKAFR